MGTEGLHVERAYHANRALGEQGWCQCWTNVNGVNDSNFILCYRNKLKLADIEPCIFWSAAERRQPAAIGFGLKEAIWVLIFPHMQDTPVESLLVKEEQNKQGKC